MYNIVVCSSFTMILTEHILNVTIWLIEAQRMKCSKYKSILFLIHVHVLQFHSTFFSAISEFQDRIQELEGNI